MASDLVVENMKSRIRTEQKQKQAFRKGSSKLLPSNSSHRF